MVTESEQRDIDSEIRKISRKKTFAILTVVGAVDGDAEKVKALMSEV